MPFSQFSTPFWTNHLWNVGIFDIFPLLSPAPIQHYQIAYRLGVDNKCRWAQHDQQELDALDTRVEYICIARNCRPHAIIIFTKRTPFEPNEPDSQMTVCPEREREKHIA